MADENEDSWLYGDSAEAKDGPSEDPGDELTGDAPYNNDDNSFQQNEDTQGAMDHEPQEGQEVT